MKIWGNCVVKNEDRYLWFAVTSVISYLDKILLWDTGSTDNTLDIVNNLSARYSGKIEVKKFSNIDIYSFTEVRKQMLEETNSDWFLVLDGDEVWWNESIEKVVKEIKENPNLDTISNSYYNLVGDIYHYQPEEAGMYKIGDKKGHLTIRAINKNIPGLKVDKPHGTQGYFDGQGNLIQDRDSKRRKYLDLKYLHFTHLTRSTSGDSKVPKRKLKQKHEIGISFPRDFYYPESLFLERPCFIKSPWERMSNSFTMRSYIETPFRKIKRKFIVSKVGY